MTVAATIVCRLAKPPEGEECSAYMVHTRKTATGEIDEGFRVWFPRQLRPGFDLLSLGELCMITGEMGWTDKTGATCAPWIRADRMELMARHDKSQQREARPKGRGTAWGRK